MDWRISLHSDLGEVNRPLQLTFEQLPGYTLEDRHLRERRQMCLSVCSNENVKSYV